MTTLTLTARLGLSVCQEQLHLVLRQTGDPLTAHTEPSQAVRLNQANQTDNTDYLAYYLLAKA